MILGPYKITDHAIKRYEQRVGKFSKMGTVKCIQSDLHFTKIKKIVTKDDGTIHVFGRYSVEFVFTKPKNGGKLLLKTVIKRNRNTNSYSVNKRLKQSKIK